MEHINIAQIIGLIAFVIQVSGYLILKNPRHILIQQSIASIPWAIHFVMLGAFPLAMIALASAGRNICGAWLPARRLKNFLIGYVLFFGTILLYNYAAPKDLLPVLSLVLISVACLQRDKPVLFFSISLLSCATWFLTHFCLGSIAGIINEIFMFGSILFALHRAYQEQTKNRKTQTPPELVAAE